MIGREYMKRRILEGKKLEWAGLILFAAAYVVISVFHEPWFDEAQAWQIAKCASLREILFQIPHYEGHPPLWHLILAIPAKLGVPFEIGLKTVGFLFSAASAALMLFRSRLPRLLRMTLPFTYFFFYQYGIVVRPYGMMLFFLMLLGMEIGNRNTNPWRVVLLLGALCLTSAYGILFAGGIAISFLWELWREKGVKRLMAELFRDGRTGSLLTLLLFALLLILEIFPAKNAYAMHIQGDTSLPVRLFCAFFTFPLDCFLSTSSWFGVEQVSMQAMSIPMPQLILGIVLGLILWMGMICVSSKRNLKFFIVPYSMYVVFAATVYFSTHHMGIVFLLVLFWAELNYRDEERFEIGRAVVSRIAKSKRDARMLHIAGFILLSACIVIPLYWASAASFLEIQVDYCFARNMAAFLKDSGLSKDPLIFCKWNYGGSTFAEANGNEDYICTDIIGTAVPLTAYFERNIVFNLNDGIPDDAYVHHRSVSYEESRETAEKWRSKGIPNVVIGYPDLEDVYESDVTAADYTCVYSRDAGFIWKDIHNSGIATVYVRNTLLDKYGLTAVDDTILRFWHEGITFTPEMREAFENGVPVEELLKPYLDAIFGEED